MINKNLKRLEINDKVFYYEVIYSSSEYGEYHTTYFYLTNDKWRQKKRFLGFFGSLISVPANEIVFTFHGDFECCSRTKKENREYLERRIELMDRCQEVKNGELI